MEAGPQWLRLRDGALVVPIFPLGPFLLLSPLLGTFNGVDRFLGPCLGLGSAGQGGFLCWEEGVAVP